MKKDKVREGIKNRSEISLTPLAIPMIAIGVVECLVLLV